MAARKPSSGRKTKASASKKKSTAKKPVKKAAHKKTTARKTTRRTTTKHASKSARSKSGGGYQAYSGKFTVRLPKSLHQALVERAEKEGVSLNLFVTNALSRTVATPKGRR